MCIGQFLYILIYDNTNSLTVICNEMKYFASHKYQTRTPLMLNIRGYICIFLFVLFADSNAI